jgi:hypothetical protein
MSNMVTGAMQRVPDVACLKAEATHFSQTMLTNLPLPSIHL